MHPYLVQQDLLDFCNEKGIHITAYAPTGKFPWSTGVTTEYIFSLSGRASVRENPMIKDLAVKYNVTPTQIILGWGLARGVSLATRSSKELHRKQALNVRISTTPPPFLVALNSSPAASRLGPGRCEEGRDLRSQVVQIPQAQRTRNRMGLDL